MPQEIGCGGGEVIHHIHHGPRAQGWQRSLLGAMHQMPASPCDVFHMDAAEHLAGFFDQARACLLQSVENRPARAVDARQPQNLDR